MLCGDDGQGCLLQLITLHQPGKMPRKVEFAERGFFFRDLDRRALAKKLKLAGIFLVKRIDCPHLHPPKMVLATP
jgi:hypothetical protein